MMQRSPYRQGANSSVNRVSFLAVLSRLAELSARARSPAAMGKSPAPPVGTPSGPGQGSEPAPPPPPAGQGVVELQIASASGEPLAPGSAPTGVLATPPPYLTLVPPEDGWPNFNPLIWT